MTAFAPSDLPIRNVTLDDVAARAGVSPKTVSRVVNGAPNVRPATQAKVEKAVTELGFRPNLAARSLAGARSYLIGAITLDLSAFYYAELYRGAARACRANGYHLIVEEVDRDRAPVDHYRSSLKTARYDGLIIPAPLVDDADLLDQLDSDGVRYVRVAPNTYPDRSSSVYCDDAVGAATLVDHFWQVGYRHFAIIIGPPQHAATRLRRDGFLSAIARRGGDPSRVTTVELVNQGSMVETGRHAAARLLDQIEQPTAVFAFNDEIAASVVALAHQRGLRLPQDIGVAGFDGSDICQLIWPTLTTIRQPIAEMAEVAVEMLIDPTKENHPRRCCPVELIVRESTTLT
jgi:LacI family transcriptional regulator